MSGQRVLVVGSSGFIGSHLTRLLDERGYLVAGLDKQPPITPQAYGVQQFLLADVLDRPALVAALAGIDAVIHLAAVHADSGHQEHEYWETNETGTRNLTEAMACSRVERLVFISSMAVYGDRLDEPDETTPPAPTSPYGASKVAAEHVVMQWAAASPTRAATIIRPSVVYGERNTANMLTLIRQIDSGWFFTFGSGHNVKATAYVENLTSAILERLEAMATGVQTFNYADKPDLTVNQIVATIRDQLHKRLATPRLPLPLGIAAALPFDLVARCLRRPLPISSARVRKLAQSTRMNAQKIRDAGFVQSISCEEGLRRMVRYYVEQKKKGQPE